MKKTLFLTLITTFILSACGVTKFESKLNKLELGMTKQEVIAQIGKNYRTEGALTTPEGNIETWSYGDPSLLSTPNERIKINFLNGRLVEWFREYSPSRYDKEVPNKDLE